MRLLIITQKVDRDDDVLGFFHLWIEEFAKHCKSVTVICLYQGNYTLPENVIVYSLGKERGASRFHYVVTFLSLIWSKRNNYDVVFVHMNLEYVLLGGPFWRLWGKSIGLKYSHRSANWRLRIAEKITNYVFSPSRESFPLLSRKLIIIGQGIDTNQFYPRSQEIDLSLPLKILTVGRISPVKHLDILLAAAQILHAQKFSFVLTIIGKPAMPDDIVYFGKLQKFVREYQLEEVIRFEGSIPYKSVAEEYRHYAVFINLCKTGAMDKTVLEAMASGLIVLTSQEVYQSVIPQDYFLSNDPEIIAKKIQLLISKPPKLQRDYVVENHSLKNVILRIVQIL